MSDTFFTACAQCGVTIERKLPRRPHLKLFCDDCFNARMLLGPSEAGALSERAAVVKYLRLVAADLEVTGHSFASSLFKEKADKVERGEHHKL